MCLCRRKCRCQPSLETEAVHAYWLTATLSNGAVTPGAVATTTHWLIEKCTWIFASSNILRLDPIVMRETSLAHTPSHRLVVEMTLPSVVELTTEHASVGLAQHDIYRCCYSLTSAGCQNIALVTHHHQRPVIEIKVPTQTLKIVVCATASLSGMECSSALSKSTSRKICSLAKLPTAYVSARKTHHDMRHARAIVPMPSL